MCRICSCVTVKNILKSFYWASNFCYFPACKNCSQQWLSWALTHINTTLHTLLSVAKQTLFTSDCLLETAATHWACLKSLPIYYIMHLLWNIQYTLCCDLKDSFSANSSNNFHSWSHPATNYLCSNHLLTHLTPHPASTIQHPSARHPTI